MPAMDRVRKIEHSMRSFPKLRWASLPQVTSANRPHNAFADSIWSIASKAKRAAQAAAPISELEKEYLTVTALQRPEESEESKLKWKQAIEDTRRVELSKIVAAAVDLSLTASRSRDFKDSIGTVIRGILQHPQPKEGWN